MTNLSSLLAPTILPILFSPILSQAAVPFDIVFNEMAWMGTKVNSSDEWIELYNNTNQTIPLEGWGLYEAVGKTLIEPLTGVIKAKSYYLIERTDDTTISDIPASQEPSGWGGSGLKNSGEHLQLLDQNSTIIDEVNCSSGWFAGEASPNYRTMERKDSQGPGSNLNNWATNNGSVINGKDAAGNPINGTPRDKNSVSVLATPKEEPPTQSEPQLESKSQTEPEIGSSSQETAQDKSQPIIYPSGILINEILPSPEGADDLGEWIELKNLYDREANLSQWKIQDTMGSITTYAFSEGTKIEAKGFLVLSRPTTKITLNNDSDGLKLIQPNGSVLDAITYEKAPRGQSYNRTEAGWAWSTILTPGSANIIPSLTSENKTITAEEKNNFNSLPAEKQLASAEKQILESKNPLPPFLAALTLAIISGISILFFKKKVVNKP